MRPALLLPGDILLYRDHGLVGNLTGWGEWEAEPGEALEYSHVCLVRDADNSAQQNPGGSKLIPLDQVPWDRVDVWRDSRLLPMISQDPVKFQAIVDQNLGQPYDYGTIVRFLGIGFLARIGLTSLAHHLTAGSVNHANVCSNWTRRILETYADYYTATKFDLFAGVNPVVGEGEEKPSDFPRIPTLKKIT